MWVERNAACVYTCAEGERTIIIVAGIEKLTTALAARCGDAR